MKNTYSSVGVFIYGIMLRHCPSLNSEVKVDFSPTELQRQLCVESLNRFKKGAGDALQDNSGALYVVLLTLQTPLKAIAEVGQAVMRRGANCRNSMLVDYTHAIGSMPPGTLAFIELWDCLRETYRPSQLMALDEEGMRQRFLALSKIANGL